MIYCTRHVMQESKRTRKEGENNKYNLLEWRVAKKEEVEKVQEQRQRKNMRS